MSVDNNGNQTNYMYNQQQPLLETEQEIKQKKLLQYYKIKIYLITFFAYGAVHSTRTCWSQATNGMQQFLSNNDISYINTTFLFCYAIAMKTVGTFGDRMNLKYFICFGMFGAALFQLAIAIYGITNHTNFWVLIVLEGFNGIFQCTQWPGLLAVMGNWYGKGNRGLLMGIWAGCCNVGDIIGYQIFSNLAFDWMGFSNPNDQWGYTILFGSCFLFLMGIIVFITVDPYPAKLGFNIQENDIPNNKNQAQSQQQQSDNQNKIVNQTEQSQLEEQTNNNNLESMDVKIQQQQPLVKINYLTAWFFPFVAIYALTYACIKSTNYGFLFWLPNYIKQMNKDHHVDMSSQNISSMFDYGTFFGGVLTGYITDRMGKRALFMIPELLFSCGLMLIVKLCLTTQNVIYYIVIFLIGFFFGGPYNVISAAIAIDLSKQKYLQNNKQALSTVSSLIESTGSFSAAVLQIFCSMMGDNLFYLFAGLTIFAACVLIYISIREKIVQKEEDKEIQDNLIRESNKN